MSDYVVLWTATGEHRGTAEHLRILQQIPPWGAELMRVIDIHRQGAKLAKYQTFAPSTNRFGPALVESHTTNG